MSLRINSFVATLIAGRRLSSCELSAPSLYIVSFVTEHRVLAGCERQWRKLVEAAKGTHENNAAKRGLGKIRIT